MKLVIVESPKKSETITRYLGGDPEFAVSNSVLYQGIDAGNVALSKTFTLGLKINL